MGQAIYDPGQEDLPAWNVGCKLGAKRPLLPKQVWAVRFFLEQEHRVHDRALFDLAIDSKLRACDLVKIKIDRASKRVSPGSRTARTSNKRPDGTPMIW
jgi:hypothetical protein